MVSHTTEKKLRKFCSLLTYLEHTNRDLYDTVHDLCGNSEFTTRGGKSITLLVPKEGSAFHNKIINEAYGDNPLKAMAMIKACILTQQYTDADGVPDLDKLRESEDECSNSLFQTLTINKSESSSSHVVLENKDGSKVTIIKDNKFIPLYNNARFAVFLIESGEIGISNSPVKKKEATETETSVKPRMNNNKHKKNIIDGGAPSLALGQSYNDNKDKFIREILNYDINNRGKQTPASFLKSETVDTFTAMAVSFMTYMKSVDEGRYKKLQSFLNVNPMCICTIIVHLVTDTEYSNWVKHDDEQLAYTYGQYKAMLPTVTKKDINSFLTSFKAGVGKPGDKSDLYKMTIDHYESVYRDDALCMLTHHESLMVADLYLKSVDEKENDIAKDYMNIYLTHYCVQDARPVIMSKETFSSTLSHQSVLCKAYEFIFSDIFLGGCTSPIGRTTILSSSVTPSSMLKGLVYIDFSKTTEGMFASK